MVSRALFPLESSSSDKQIKVRQNLPETYDHTDFAHLGILNPSAHCICTAELTILKKKKNELKLETSLPCVKFDFISLA